MNEYLKTVTEEMHERYGAQVDDSFEQVRLLLGEEQLIATLRLLRDAFEFDLLLDITAVDYWPQLEPRFNVVYQLYSINRNENISLRVPVNNSRPVLPSITPLFTNANWFERELWDMFGIRFEGHPDMRRIIMPYDWQGHPLRKDYPLGYEEVQFTFNFNEINLRKPYAKE
jgi:NADH-quinone oxidoreductase subunit C